jgi:hypothetical protein
LIPLIKGLEETASLKGFKEGWSYYRFIDKSEALRDAINNKILVNTCYCYEPIIFFNQYNQGFDFK